MDEGGTVDDVRTQAIGESLGRSATTRSHPCQREYMLDTGREGECRAHEVHLYLPCCVKLEMPIPFESPFDQLPELGWEARVVKVMHAQSGPGSL